MDIAITTPLVIWMDVNHPGEIARPKVTTRTGIVDDKNRMDVAEFLGETCDKILLSYTLLPVNY